jgi:hypothetical protein
MSITLASPDRLSVKRSDWLKHALLPWTKRASVHGTMPRTWCWLTMRVRQVRMPTADSSDDSLPRTCARCPSTLRVRA